MDISGKGLKNQGYWSITNWDTDIPFLSVDIPRLFGSTHDPLACGNVPLAEHIQTIGYLMLEMAAISWFITPLTILTIAIITTNIHNASYWSELPQLGYPHPVQCVIVWSNHRTCGYGSFTWGTTSVWASGVSPIWSKCVCIVYG